MPQRSHTPPPDYHPPLPPPLPSSGDLTTPGKGRPPHYPWDDYCDGAWWTLAEGVDYRGSVQSLRALMRHQARKRALRLTTMTRRTQTGAREISFCFYRFEPGDLQPDGYDRVLDRMARDDLHVAKQRVRMQNERMLARLTDTEYAGPVL